MLSKKTDILTLLIVLLTWSIGLLFSWPNLKQHYFFTSNRHFINYIDSYFNSTRTTQQHVVEWLANNSNNSIYFDDYLFSKRFYNSNNILCVGLISKERFSEQKYDYVTQTLISIVTRVQLKHRNKISISIFDVGDSPFKLKNIVPVIPLASNGLYSNRKINEAINYAQAMRIIAKRNECRHALLIEDDSIVAPDWYTKLCDAIRKIENKQDEWMSLKLFTSFRHFDWLTHFETVFNSILFICLLFLIQFKTVSNRFVGTKQKKLKAFVLFVNLFFFKWLLNSNSISPLGYGLKKFSQGFNTVAVVYPKEQLNFIAEYLEDKINSHLTQGKLFLPKDLAISQYRRDNHLREYILEPSIVQHVGVHSSLRNDIFNRNSNRNIIDYQYRPFHSYSFMKEYSDLIKFEDKFW